MHHAQTWLAHWQGHRMPHREPMSADWHWNICGSVSILKLVPNFINQCTQYRVLPPWKRPPNILISNKQNSCESSKLDTNSSSRPTSPANTPCGRDASSLLLKSLPTIIHSQMLRPRKMTSFILVILCAEIASWQWPFHRTELTMRMRSYPHLINTNRYLRLVSPLKMPLGSDVSLLSHTMLR